MLGDDQRRPAWLAVAYRHRGVLAVLFAATVFAVLVSELLTLRYLAFETAAWDLGNYNQAFYTTISGQGFFYYTADLPSGNQGHLLAAHSSFVLVMLAPLYAIAPGPPTLLVLETVGSALAAVPLYFLVRKELGSERWAVFFALLFLASPVLLGIVWYDFHPEAFLPLGILSTILFYRLRRWALFLGAWVFTLLIIETAAPLLIAFVVLAVIGDYFVKQGPWRSAWRRVPVVLWIALAGAIVWLTMTSISLPLLFGGSGAYSAAYGVNFEILGAGSLPAVIPTALLHPSRAWSALTYGGTDKVTYVVFSLLAFGFLPLIGRLRYFLPGLVWPVLALLSNNHGYFAFGDQYAAYTFPFWAASAAVGFGRLREWSKRPVVPTPGPDPANGTAIRGRRARLWRRLHAGTRTLRQQGTVVGAVLLLLGLGLGLRYISPLNPNPTDSLGIPHGWPTVTAHDDLLRQIIGMIPASAGVLTTQFLFPEVSNRPNAYVLPISSYFAGNLTFIQALDHYVNESSYLLYDLTSDPFSANLMESLVNFSGFGILAEADGILLYERGWLGAPELWTPVDLNITGGSLAVSPAVAVGPVGPYANVLRYSGGGSNGTQIWAGPYVLLPPGAFRVSFTYATPGETRTNALEIGISARPVVYTIVPSDVTGAGHDYAITRLFSDTLNDLALADVPGSGSSTPVTVSLNVIWPAPALLTLSGWARATSAEIDLYSVSVVQTEVA